MTGIAIVSGGMDSVTMAYHLSTEDELILVSFDYGQRHRKELRYAAWNADQLEMKHIVVPMGFMADLLHGSSLTSGDVEVPDGHYAEETMKATVVPNRNMIMLSIAAGIAVAESANYIATAVHAGDHFIYPDCRPEFIEAVGIAIDYATAGFSDWSEQPPVVAPFVDISKDEIVRIGDRLDVPYEMTWTCYKGGENHCGRCGTCVERKEAFRLANVLDPTIYDDQDFLIEANQIAQ